MSTSIAQDRSTNNKTKPNNEADIIFNRANVALARSQRLVASWLPPAADTDEKNSGTTESERAELQRLEDEMFTPVPERLGLGAPIPKQQGVADKLWHKTELSADDKLRQTLLGRNYKKIQEQKQAAATAAAKNRMAGNANTQNKTNNVKSSVDGSNGNNDDDDDEEEEGRSALGKSKKTKTEKTLPAKIHASNDTDERDDLAENKEGNTSPPPSPPPIEQPATKSKKTTASSKRKGAGNFLDELLSDRKKKRKK